MKLRLKCRKCGASGVYSEEELLTITDTDCGACGEEGDENWMILGTEDTR